MVSIRIIFFSVAVAVDGLFLQDVRKAFEMELRKLMTEASQSQGQMSNVDAINQAKRQGIATLDAMCNCTVAAPYSMFLWVKHIVTEGHGIYSMVSI